MLSRKVCAAVAACALVGCMGLAGCSSASSSNGDATDNTTTTEATTEEQTDSSSDTDYAVSIDACELTTNYQGAEAIVATITWTNGSDETCAFGWTIDAAAYQNGVELDIATISVTNETYDTSAQYNQVQPGATQTVQVAFSLTDHSDVTIICDELFSFDSATLAEQTFTLPEA